MKVLVTGANGFLGSWVVRRLIDQGLDVKILHRSTSDLSELDGLNYESALGDVTNAASLIDATKDIDTVFHLAGVVAYMRSQRPIMEAVNVDGTANVIEAVQKNKVRKLVHLSSVTAIGASFDGTPLNEESPFNLHHLNLGYFETKLAGEKLVTQAVKEQGLDAVILNPSTIYGPGDAKKGSRGMQLKVARGKMPLYTSGGVSVVSVEHTVDAILAAWEKGRTGERYILSGENITIKRLFEIIAKEAGVKPPSIFLPNWLAHSIGKFGDLLEKTGRKGPLNGENSWTATLYHWFDSSKAQKELGLKTEAAEVSIGRSIEWCKKNGLI